MRGWEIGIVTFPIILIIFWILVILTLLFQGGFITGRLLIVFYLIPIVNTFFSPNHHVFNSSDSSQLSDSLLAFIFRSVIVFNLFRLQYGALIVLDLFDASTQLILKQEGQRKEFTNYYKEKEERAPIISNKFSVNLPPESVFIHKI